MPSTIVPDPGVGPEGASDGGGTPVAARNLSPDNCPRAGIVAPPFPEPVSPAPATEDRSVPM